MRVSTKELVCLVILVLLAFSPAHAALVISSAPSANVTCTLTVCTATAANAVLNVNHLQNLLARENVKVATGNSANNISISAALNWISTKTLTLDARRFIVVNQPVSVSGSGGLALLTNDGGTGGSFLFGKKGNITFWNLSSSLTINGAAYTLVNNIPSLASDVAANPTGHFALASNYDASAHGSYTLAAIETTFNGTFEGLGNTISNFTLANVSRNHHLSAIYGMFSVIEDMGKVENLSLINVSMIVDRQHVAVGALAGESVGVLSRIFVSGTFSVGNWAGAGGIVGDNSGTIVDSHSTATIRGGGSNCYLGSLTGGNNSVGVVRHSYATGAVAGSGAGGLVGANDGTIARSYATGAVGGPQAGGLVSLNRGAIKNSYATGAVSGGNGAILGGLVGRNSSGASLPQGIIIDSYSTGSVVGGASTILGGFVGEDDNTSGSITDSYWDATSSGIANSTQGAGNIANDTGITGLTTTQLQSGLPAGFDPSIWGENPSINGGLPYLHGNPPT